ncbi:MAG: transporter substrate-binding domain-containing protein [Kordiimonadaceae bacterium]|nr:transporter substrate-binding domain-containing protein [Kordiimonadaceae bacterium]
MVFAIFLCTFAPTAASQEQETIKVGYNDFWPIAFTEDDIAKGEWVEAMHGVLKGLGKPHNFTEYPIKRMFMLIRTGELHIGMYTPSAGYEDDTILISTQALSYIGIRLYAATPNAFENFTSIYDIRNESIITISGYSYSGIRAEIEASTQNIQFLDTPTHTTAFAMLKAGRAKYVLDYTRPVLQIKPDIDMPSLSSELVKSIPVLYVVSKKVANPQELMRRLELETERLRQQPKTPSETK